MFNKINSPGIANNRFVSVFEDRFGDLWAGLEIGGLVRRHQGRFTTINMDWVQAGFPVFVYGDEEGNMVINLWGRIYRWRDDGFQPADDSTAGTLQNDPQHPGFSPLHLKIPEEWRAKVTGTRKDGKGNIWASTAQSLVRFREGRAAQVYDQRVVCPAATRRSLRASGP